MPLDDGRLGSMTHSALSTTDVYTRYQSALVRV
jgi:hypothetical protein